MLTKRLFGSGAYVLFSAGMLSLFSSCVASPERGVTAGSMEMTGAARCADLADLALAGAPVDGLAVTKAAWIARGTSVETRGGPVDDFPSHCLIEGHFAERQGTLDQTYRIAFRMRLPGDWNGRFYFQGGGGSNGVVGDATGFNGPGNAAGLARGYAVIAQDSGHDDQANTLPDHQGTLVFGFDPEARRNYGHASLKPVNDLGHHLLRSYYGADSETDIFWGCSKGGQEGMAFAQRYPEAFDGIVAMAPGMSLPRAAVAEAWDTQALAGIARVSGETLDLGSLRLLIKPSQYVLFSEGILEACDTLDGARDGIIGAVGQCTTERVLPELRKRQCSEYNTDACLKPAQVDALVAIMDGARNSSGDQLYAPWAWDSGIMAPGWAVWKTGLEGGSPALNVTLGASSLAAVFMTPPIALSSDPKALLAWQLAFDFDRDAVRIYETQPPFESSAWQDIGMRSTDLSAFRKHGGKLIVPHGVSDPVFSVLDTIDWWQELDERQGGTASDFARVFPVPGMNHCGGGPATDSFDSLSALERWLEEGKAPDSIRATAGQRTPWPGRVVPLCPYPQVALWSEAEQYRCGMLPPQAMDRP